MNDYKIDDKLFNMSGYYRNPNEDHVKIPSYSRTNNNCQEIKKSVCILGEIVNQNSTV